MSELTRRRLLTSAGVGAAGLSLGAGGYLIGHETAEASNGEGTGSVPFYGEHQAGIDTAAQDRLHFAAFDLLSEDPAELRELMRAWTVAAAEAAAGEMVGNVNDVQLAPPDDTGETVGLLPSRLTITFGFGPSLFEKPGLGLAGKRPAALQPLPPLPADELNPGESGGDVCVQACSDDPQVAFHAIRNLARIGRGTVAMRWSQLGFGRTASTSRSQDTLRNLMGMKDGTANIRAEDTEAMAKFVWVESEGPAWMRGGSYLVTRRIRMLLEVWDRTSLQDQERTIGRHKYSGAPLGGRDEFEPLPLARQRNGHPVIPPTPTSASPRRRRTAAPASCAAATPSPTASTRASASSKPGSSSSASSATRSSSSRSSGASARWTRSTSTSSTSAAPSSRCPPAPNPAATSASPYSAEACLSFPLAFDGKAQTPPETSHERQGETHQMNPNLVRSVICAGAVGLVAVFATACGSSDDETSSDGSVTAAQIGFTVTDAGCEPIDAEAPAGPITFEAENDGATEVNELEILDGETVLGEVPNIGSEGDSGTISLTLEQGEYTILCPGGDGEPGTLTVSGELETANSPAVEEAVETYRAYLEENTAELVEATEPFVAAVVASDIAKAKSLYPAARIPYERIEPVAESFGSLDPRIDARENDVPPSEFEGFHRLEKALWEEESLKGMAPVAEHLLADVEELAQKVKTVELQAVQIANGANELLAEVSASKITGEEERYSHIDLVDFEANVEGSEAAFEAVKPLLDETDPELAGEIEADFKAVFNSLEPHRTADGFVSYTELTKADTRKLATAIDTLAEKLSQVPAAIAQAEHE